jgi:hypothetical protein
MPPADWRDTGPMLEKISAKYDGEPCCRWIGTNGEVMRLSTARMRKHRSASMSWNSKRPLFSISHGKEGPLAW